MTDSTNAKLRELRERVVAQKEHRAKAKMSDIYSTSYWYLTGLADGENKCLSLIDAMIQEAGE